MIVGKQTDSKKSVMNSIAIPTCFVCVTDAARKATVHDKYTRKTQRARTNFIIPEPRKRPTANAPCAPARYFADVAFGVPGQVSLT